jgi:hypothetical protein
MTRQKRRKLTGDAPRRRIQRPARKTRETFKAIERLLLKLEAWPSQDERAIAQVTFRQALRDLSHDMDSMAQARTKIRHLRWALRVLFQPRARERYLGFTQVKVFALGDLMTLRHILDDYTRE